MTPTARAALERMRTKFWESLHVRAPKGSRFKDLLFSQRKTIDNAFEAALLAQVAATRAATIRECIAHLERTYGGLPEVRLRQLLAETAK